MSKAAAEIPGKQEDGTRVVLDVSLPLQRKGREGAHLHGMHLHIARHEGHGLAHLGTLVLLVRDVPPPPPKRQDQRTVHEECDSLEGREEGERGQ